MVAAPLFFSCLAMRSRVKNLFNYTKPDYNKYIAYSQFVPINQFRNLFRMRLMASVEQLLRALGRRGVASGRELASQLGVSQPTLSRLVIEAGERVCRMGRARATRYALSRLVAGLGTRLPVYQVDERGSSQRYGLLHLLAGGRHWVEREGHTGALFEGLPPFAWDVAPQGYVGRSFPALYPELGLPPRITDWHDDHRLLALARRGDDCVGDLILGEEPLNRFLAHTPIPARREEYPELARAAASGQAGSSAGGEHPKFLAYVDGRHVLVKYADADASAAAKRWRDLLVCECAALEAVRAAGLPAAAAKWYDIGGSRFLEVERFDRIGARGRKGVISLAAIDNEYFGYRDSWTKSAQRLLAERLLDPEDGRRLRWLDAFAQLIGNNDRHFGNISFFGRPPEIFRLAPVYDMLPMAFAPQGTSLIDRPFKPQPPNADNLDVWLDAARCALAYWGRLQELSGLTRGFRDRCSACRDDVATLASRFDGGLR